MDGRSIVITPDLNYKSDKHQNSIREKTIKVKFKITKMKCKG